MQTEKQRERLVELITEFETNDKVRCPKYDEPFCEGCEYDLGAECDKTSILADYLIANNVVVLPCVVGQTVWCIYNYEKPKEFQVAVLSVSEHHYSFTIEANEGVFKHYCDKDAVGKWVFFTKEEAEAKLREMRDGT